MQQIGTASVYGIQGAVDYTAYVIPESLESDNPAQLDEFRSGINQLLGWYKTNEQITAQVVLVPKAASRANARAAIDFPAGPCKVTLSGFENQQGAAVSDWGIRDINGDYIYTQGAQRSLSKGQATFRISLFRPLDVPDAYLEGGLVTKGAITSYINALVTPIA